MADQKLGADVKGVLALVVLLVLVALAVGDDTFGLLVGCVVFPLLIYAMTRVPIRQSLLGLMFLALTLENPAEQPAENAWQSPLFTVGAVMLNHINTILPWKALFFSGMDICLGALIVIALFRRSSRSKIDRAGRVATPKPLIQLAFLSLLGTAFTLFSGLARGGEFGMALWQLDRVVYLPVVFLLFQSSFRGPRDHAALARVFLTAVTIRALLAVYVITTVSGPLNPHTGSTRLNYATSHHDSVSFAAAFVLLVSLLLERAGRRARKLVFVFLPIVAMGMWANNRRMAWVQVALVLLTIYFATPDNPVKRKIRRGLFVAVPALVGYILVGWNSGSRIFKPVQIMRSVVDSQSDTSTMWREIENYNLIFTLRQNPLFGTGFGHRFIEVVALPEVPYSLEYYLPHNSVLGLWAFTGYVGYTCLTLFWAAAAYFAMRAYRGTKDPVERAVAVTCFGIVLIYMVQCWGDLGLGSWIAVYLVASALTVSGKLAVSVGQWPAAEKRKREEAPARNGAAARGARQPA